MYIIRTFKRIRRVSKHYNEIVLCVLNSMVLPHTAIYTYYICMYIGLGLDGRTNILNSAPLNAILWINKIHTHMRKRISLYSKFNIKLYAA